MLRDQLFILTVVHVTGLNSRTIIVIVTRVFHCFLKFPKVLNGRFCFGFGSRIFVGVKYFFVHFERLVKMFSFVF